MIHTPGGRSVPARAAAAAAANQAGQLAGKKTKRTYAPSGNWLCSSKTHGTYNPFPGGAVSAILEIEMKKFLLGFVIGLLFAGLVTVIVAFAAIRLGNRTPTLSAG